MILGRQLELKISSRYLLYFLTLVGVLGFATGLSTVTGFSPYLILLGVALLVAVPILAYGVLLDHRFVFLFLMAAFPFHSLMVRVVAVDMGLTGPVASLFTVWKELVILLLLGRVIIAPPKYFTALDALIGFYIIFSFFYAIWPGELIAGFYGFRGVVEPFAIYFLVRIVGLYRHNIDQLFRVLVRVGAIIGVFAIFQFLFLDASFVWTYKAIDGVLSNSHTTRLGGRFIYRSSATFTSPNHLGMYLAILALVTTGVYLESRLTLRKILIPLSLMGLGIISSFSRSSWLALISGIFILLLIKVIKRKVKREIIVGAFVLSIVAIPAVYFLGVLNYVISTISLDELSAAGKIPSIIQGLNFLVDNPLGIGLGLAGPRSTRFGELTVHSENFYIITGMESGIIGLTLYLTILALFCVRIYKIYKALDNRFEKGICLGTLAATIGAHVGVLFIPSLQELSVATLLWLFIGISIHFHYLYRHDQLHNVRTAVNQNQSKLETT